ncbi:MAG: hypothetical protein ACFB51_17750, partial [Anaerolineae bacterium]
MRRTSLILLSSIILLTACAGVDQAAVLPTATVEPTPVTPTATATFLPPPTVTPFPTVTPRAPVDPDDGTPEEETEGSQPTSEADTPQPATQPAPTDPPVSPGSESAAVPPGINVGEQLLDATFDQGWPNEDSPTADYGLVNGVYRFEIGPFDGRFINSTVVDETNFYAQVAITPETCPPETGYGMFFHYVDSWTYHAITLFCEGNYVISTRISGLRTNTQSGDLPGGLDPSSTQTHTLGVEARAA